MLQIPENFEHYLQQKDDEYRSRLARIILFDESISKEKLQTIKSRFASVFYHIRGHFIDFMWYLANFSDNDALKDIIINNIKEELGFPVKYSHEKLYEHFATACQVNIQEELIEAPNYLPFARQFNQGHLRWLSQHDEDIRLASFASYERLDNIDYVYLNRFAESLSLSKDATLFFRAHIHVEHFASTLILLSPVWVKYPDKVKLAFNFIYHHQLTMWQALSDCLFKVP